MQLPIEDLVFWQDAAGRALGGILAHPDRTTTSSYEAAAADAAAFADALIGEMQQRAHPAPAIEEPQTAE
jgi:hypothetical protein